MKTERVTDEMVERARMSLVLGEDAGGNPVHLSAEEARIVLTAALSSAEEKAVEGCRRALERIANASVRAWNVNTATEALNTARAIAASALDALVDVPAVEREPVAWTSPGQLREIQKGTNGIVTKFGDEFMSIPLFAHHPRSSLIQSEEGENERLRRALLTIAHTFTEDSHGGTKSLPAYEYQKMARDALSTPPSPYRGDNGDGADE